MAYRTFVHWAALTSCLCVMSSAAAQTTTVPGSNTVTEFKGSLKGFQRGVLVVTRDDGTDVMVQLPDDISSFNFVATAKPAFLRRGTMVRFSGMFGPGGVALAPIRQIEVFQPIPAAKIVGRLRERYVPGVYVDRAQQPQQAMAKYYIVGNLMGVAPGMMMVQAGKASMRVPLADDAEFELRFNNLTLAQEGDPVSVAGFYQPPDDTKVKADRVTITTDRVYGEATDQPPTRRTARRRTRPGEGDAEEASAEKPEAGEKPESAEGEAKAEDESPKGGEGDNPFKFGDEG